MNQRTTLLSAAVLGGLTVGLGAFGAHALKPILLQNGRVEVYELATRYQFYHTLALLAVGILQHWYSNKQLQYASFCMLTGTVLFSGSLYLLSFISFSLLGPITPIGGVFLIMGWVFLLVGIYKK